MLSTKFLSVALVAIAVASSLLVDAKAMAHPYAPELYAREGLSLDEADEGRMTLKKRAALPNDAQRPYSPDLYFRDGLVDEDMERRQAPTPSQPNLNRRSDSTTFCRRDADCGSSHFCGSGGSCYMRLKRRSLCSRDSMCSSGFCGSGGSCLAKRTLGASCLDGGASACAENLFCSTVDNRCKQKRSLNQGCRTTDGCAEGLACLNYQCQQALLEEGSDKLKSFLGQIFNQGPSPSGSAQFPRWFAKRDGSEKRFLPAPPSASGSAWDPIKLTDLENIGGDFQDQLTDAINNGEESLESLLEKRFLPAPPSPSGSARDPVKLASVGGDLQGKLSEAISNGQESLEDIVEKLQQGPN